MRAVLKPPSHLARHNTSGRPTRWPRHIPRNPIRSAAPPRGGLMRFGRFSGRRGFGSFSVQAHSVSLREIRSIRRKRRKKAKKSRDDKRSADLDEYTNDLLRLRGLSPSDAKDNHRGCSVTQGHATARCFAARLLSLAASRQTLTSSLSILEARRSRRRFRTMAGRLTWGRSEPRRLPRRVLPQECQKEEVRSEIAHKHGNIL